MIRTGYPFLLERITIAEESAKNLIKILQSDPRPHYHNDDRVYAFEFSKYHIEFKVESDRLTVTDLTVLKDGTNV